jgi:hypothetical protein
MEALLGFRTSSSTHENGFVAAANCFVCLTGRRAAGAGEPCDSGDRPALDSPQKPDSPAAFLDSGRGHAGSAVRLKDHVDPYRNEQGDCRKPAIASGNRTKRFELSELREAGSTCYKGNTETERCKTGKKQTVEDRVTSFGG